MFVNRVMKKHVEDMNASLMGFDHHPLQNDHKKNKQSHGSENIYGCLEAFRSAKKLDKENAWYCNICKNHVEATKKIELYSAPPILVFCLQRFKSQSIYFKDKLEDKIDFPVTGLDMTPYVLS